MKRLFLTYVVLLLSSSCTTLTPGASRFPANASIDISMIQNKLQPFTTDGCSKFSNGIAYPKEDKWGLCCVQHDISYWKGGTSDDRFQADQRLQNCIIEVGEPNIARLVYWGVRASGTEGSSTNRQWGYGWVLNRGYAPFSVQEKTQVETLEKQIPTELSKVPISDPSKAPKDKETLTGNYCIDSSIMFIQKNLSRQMTPLMAHEQQKDVPGGIEYTVSIMTKECHKPYAFTYVLTQKDSCTRKLTEQRYRLEVNLKDIDYPEECQ